MRLILLAACIAIAASADEPKPPSVEQQAAFIADVRQKALAYTQSLSDFLCTQSTRRYSATPTKDGEPSWKLQDTFTLKVSYFKQNENYRVIVMNGKTVDKPITHLSGHRTEGEFGTILKDLFSEGNQAKLSWKSWSTRDNRPVAVLEFRIDQAHSSFQTVARRMIRKTSCRWGVEGTLDVNAETRQVMAVTLHSADIPPECPAKEVQMTVTYGYRKIGDREFLLPVQSESRVNIFGQLVRAESEFANYRKFSADTDIKFDLPAPDAPPPHRSHLR